MLDFGAGAAMKKPAIAIAVIALIGAPAFAADMAVKAPPPAPAPAAYDWSGFYIGANAGYGWNDPTVAITPNDNFFAAVGNAAPFGPLAFNMSGAIGGFQAGYNWQWKSNWIVGIEADFDFSSVKGSASATSTLAGASFVTSASQNHRWFGTLRPRIGYLANSQLMIYATGGLAYGRVTDAVGIYSSTGIGLIGFGAPPRDLNCSLGINPCLAGNSSRTDVGWTAGGGAEYAWTSHLSLRAEYLFVDLGRDSLTVIATQPPVVPGRTTPTLTASYSAAAFNIVRAGINYKF
jgi:outer membrane immunogenic protein